MSTANWALIIPSDHVQCCMSLLEDPAMYRSCCTTVCFGETCYFARIWTSISMALSCLAIAPDFVQLWLLSAMYQRQVGCLDLHECNTMPSRQVEVWTVCSLC